MSAEPLRRQVEQSRLRLRRWLIADYAGAEPLASEADYAALSAEVAALEARAPHLRDWDSPTTRVLPPTQDPFPERPHAAPMLSLANVYSVDELREWEGSLRRLLPDDAAPTFLAELKIDGVALSIHYREGVLVSAVTRGDGTVGEEVTRNSKTLQGLPHRLPEPLTLEVRGEVYYTLDDFGKINRQRERAGEAPFKNPRNAAAGTLRMLDTALVGRRRLRVAIYALATPALQREDSDERTLGWLAGLGLPVSAPLRRCAGVAEVAAYYEETRAAREKLPFHIDGLVVKVDRFSLREQAGFTSKSPRWAVALKFGAEQAETTLEAVEVGVGRTGVLTPIARLTPVELGGTTVSRATLHNYDQIERLALMQGDRVLLEKGGDIIPKVVAVLAEARADGRTREPIRPPAGCPSCGVPPLRLEGEVDYHCLNPACPAQQLERIRHFVSRRAMDIESLGPVLLEQLIRKGHVRTFADLYRLKADDLEGLERMGKKSAANVIEAIAGSRTRPLDKFLHGLGIRYVGERAARVLARHFGSLQALREASVEDFENLAEIGAVTARSLFAFFEDDAQRALIEQCLALGLAPTPVAGPTGEAQPLAGRTVVISGTLSAPRAQWKERLERAGATVTGSVSQRTDYLLAGESPGSKLEAAREHGVTVVDEARMNALLEEPA